MLGENNIMNEEMSIELTECTGILSHKKKGYSWKYKFWRMDKNKSRMLSAYSDSNTKALYGPRFYKCSER